ncbi:hypothetical protein EW146_g2391 [Bondarzewia mesenterica]|uniref:Thioredoxin-like fold domain-containing protein n=1 Tax=Bondarzewia mesenterica TaxID=1095465 RepID=A0A4S4M2Q3_9AGAM|nr:hypothetical protein EW146_g2391 [Bondarzewia mesenterica]
MASIKLYGFPKTDPNAPSVSGFCQKLETFLRATSFTSYTLESTTPSSAPKGKLPYIVLTHADGRAPETIADSHFIICRLVALGLAPDLDASLTPAQRADSRAWQAWTEELLYTAVVQTRWARDHNYAATYASMSIPGLVKPIVMWSLRRRLVELMRTVGIGKHSVEEVDQLMKEWVDGLDARLEGKTFFHGGEHPTLVDIVLGGFLIQCVGQRSNAEFKKMVMENETLKAYTARSTKTWFPEYKELLKELE